MPAPEDRRLYEALVARDARFDGLFFVGVSSTGIYCRPICPARTPKAAHCRFFGSAHLAERAGFRPCLRCRPELAPGTAPIDDGQRIAASIVQRLDEGEFDERIGLDAIADQFELSSRQIRRIVQRELGVSPLHLLLTRRLLLAKQLLTETTLPVADVAFASGFSSVRRFNDAFARRYAMPPTRLRRTAGDGDAVPDDGSSVLQLVYRPPYDWAGMLAFLRARALRGVEAVTDDAYARTVSIGNARGWMRVTAAPDRHALLLEFSHSLSPVLPALLRRTRALLDLDARPDVIAAHLSGDSRLRPAVLANSGLRLPGAFDGFEVGMRAILGQQVTVRAATTLASRLVEAFGDPCVTPIAGLQRLAPAAGQLAAVRPDQITRHGVTAPRAASLTMLARALASGDLSLDDASQRTDDLVERLRHLPGIGPWTAQYVVMRALRWPDAFPKEDVVLRKVLGGVTPREAERLAESWRPWRSYAVMHLWRVASGGR